MKDSIFMLRVNDECNIDITCHYEEKWFIDYATLQFLISCNVKYEENAICNKLKMPRKKFIDSKSYFLSYIN